MINPVSFAIIVVLAYAAAQFPGSPFEGKDSPFKEKGSASKGRGSPFPLPEAPKSPFEQIHARKNGGIDSQPALEINGTKEADIIIKEMRKEINQAGLNSTKIPEQNFEFQNQSITLENGTIKNMGNIYRVGDVLVTVELTNTKLRTAMAVYNATADTDAKMQTKNFKNVSHGHIHSDIDNVTVYSVFKFDHLTQDITLDEFEVTIGEITNNVTGFGKEAKKGSDLSNLIADKIKGPILKVFNVSFRLAVNAAIKAAKTALVASMAAG